MKITIKNLKKLIKEIISEPIVGSPKKSLSREKMDQIDQVHGEPRPQLNQKAMNYAKQAIAINPNLDLELAYRVATDNLPIVVNTEKALGKDESIKKLIKMALGKPAIAKKL